MNQLWKRCGLAVARFALSAWVGAAFLFVICGVRLVTSDAFDSVGRDSIAALRFPLYYGTGTTLFALAACGLIVATGLSGLSRRRWSIALMLIIVAAGLLLADYLWIYTPLARMITPPGSPRPTNFEWYHRASEMINSLQVGLCLVAALVCNWPLRASLD